MTHSLFQIMFCIFAGHEANEANHLVAKALSAEAYWHNFPGFVADIEVQLSGKTSFGRLIVRNDGQVFVEQVPSLHHCWALKHLGCVVRQRLPMSEFANKTWMFVNFKEEGSSPGKAVCRTDAPLGPDYWIQNGQFRAIDSQSARHKQRVTRLKSEPNRDNKQLPVAQVLHVWNAQTLKLETTETTLLSWQLVDGFDLPVSIEVLCAGAAIDQLQAPVVGRILLRRHQLFPAREGVIAKGRPDRPWAKK